MNHIGRRKLTIIKGIVVGAVIIFLYFNAKAVNIIALSDGPVSSAIKFQIGKKKLNYPRLVEGFYKQKAYKLAWIAPDTVQMHAMDAMLLLDCVLQYGFDHQDYHPQELVYDQLHFITELNNKAGINDKASFDVLLTDAMITFINNLHYGKLNPEFPAAKIDLADVSRLNAANLLVGALSDQNFMTKLLNVQPQSKVYRDLQDMMRLMTGQYIGDCYVVPPGQIRKVAINMERLRWLNNASTNYITINIPSNSLWYHNGGDIDRFKVDVQLPIRSLPTAETSLTALRTGTQFSILQRKVSASKGLLILDFQNDFYSYFPIGDNIHVYVKHGERLANLILFNDGSSGRIQDLFEAMHTGIRKRFKLKTAVPVKIIYITCEMKEGILVQYPDSYRLDTAMENALYKAQKI